MNKDILWSRLFKLAVLGKFLKGVFEIILCVPLFYFLKMKGFDWTWVYLEKYEIFKGGYNIFSIWAYFLIFCLFIHGLIKIITVFFLLRKKLWIYQIVIYVYSFLAVLLIIKYCWTPMATYLWTALSYAIFGKLTIYEYKKVKLVIK
ncbi:MAG: hypothetical protein PHX34_00405 [Candidatus Shapirobacteria bacterium]|nr:hypothetical protein [Candidatus Shapirobacteria bacterium]